MKIIDIMQNIFNFVRNRAIQNEKFDNVNDVVNDYYRNHFVIVDSKSFKSIIVVFEIVKQQDFFSNRRHFRKNRRFNINKNYIRLNYTLI